MIKFSGGDTENMKSIGVEIFRLQQNQINTLTPIQACLIFKSVQLCGVFSQLIYNQCPAPQMFPLWRSMSLQSLNPSFLKKWVQNVASSNDRVPTAHKSLHTEGATYFVQ